MLFQTKTFPRKSAKKSNDNSEASLALSSGCLKAHGQIWSPLPTELSLPLDISQQRNMFRDTSKEQKSMVSNLLVIAILTYSILLIFLLNALTSQASQTRIGDRKISQSPNQIENILMSIYSNPNQFPVILLSYTARCTDNRNDKKITARSFAEAQIYATNQRVKDLIYLRKTNSQI